LLVQDRIQSRHNLHKKNIVDCAACTLCNHDDETTDHIIFSYPTAAAFWSSIGVTAASSPSVRELWNAGVPPSTL
jgi:hypothetical protein